MRAQRFPLKLPIRYRRVGEAGWMDGTTENISYSGVLFRADGVLDKDTAIEIDITLPGGTAAAAVSDLVCHARIVRAEKRVSERRTALAAAFSEYRFIPALGRS